ncbi:MAG: ATP synthase F1 subunit gamma [Candidatus Karelsulcia muelleri]|uniref:ATP synthase F1 subunit gamma n=1 Tax=Candidatus Karelsulcia muelleri TaxID=336810 RepID=UPI000D7B9CFD|nr:ATP synthase F1 subunit gamma [Candidatus Karelsulcia muelleri]
MSNLKELINRVKTVSSIVKMTSAMKLVSSRNLKKTQEKLLNLNFYKSNIEKIFKILLLNNNNFLFKKKKKNTILLIVLTSNRGLCGSFNNFLLKISNYLINNFFKKKNIYILFFGKKGKELFSKKYPIYVSNSNLIENINFKILSNIIKDIYKNYKIGNFIKIIMIYNNSKNIYKKFISIKQILPVKINKHFFLKKKKYFIFEPSKKKILKFLFPEMLKLKIYNSILESKISEHSSRMMAMQKAKDNGLKIKKELFYYFNKIRKENITKEILEIIGGI